LESQIEQCGPFPLKALLTTGRQIAAGLAAAHAKNIIHRDIKPGNVLIEAETGRVKLTDFGLAWVADDSKHSTEGLLAGTPLYMAPSVIHGQPADQLSDLFSLGGVLYAMATGRPPFPGQTLAAVLRAVCESEPIPPRQLRPDLPSWLEDLILSLLHKDPARRFSSARQVVAVFEQQSRS
jgi:serine/threonine protein kinase